VYIRVLTRDESIGVKAVVAFAKSIKGNMVQKLGKTNETNNQLL
jgi:hypothetical protein